MVTGSGIYKGTADPKALGGGGSKTYIIVQFGSIVSYVGVTSVIIIGGPDYQVAGGAVIYVTGYGISMVTWFPLLPECRGYDEAWFVTSQPGFQCLRKNVTKVGVNIIVSPLYDGVVASMPIKS
jgi:hypothetical protein